MMEGQWKAKPCERRNIVIHGRRDKDTKRAVGSASPWSMKLSKTLIKELEEILLCGIFVAPLLFAGPRTRKPRQEDVRANV